MFFMYTDRWQKTISTAIQSSASATARAEHANVSARSGDQRQHGHETDVSRGFLYLGDPGEGAYRTVDFALHMSNFLFISSYIFFRELEGFKI